MATQSTKAAVENFVGQHKLAVVGVSRDTKKFGNMAYKALKEKGYQVYPINRNVEAVEGDRCYTTLAALPEKVDGVLVIVPPTETEKVVREVDAAGIKNVWMQQGAESDEAIRIARSTALKRCTARASSWMRVNKRVVILSGMIPLDGERVLQTDLARHLFTRRLELME